MVMKVTKGVVAKKATRKTASKTTLKMTPPKKVAQSKATEKSTDGKSPSSRKTAKSPNQQKKLSVADFRNTLEFDEHPKRAHYSVEAAHGYASFSISAMNALRSELGIGKIFRQTRDHLNKNAMRSLERDMGLGFRDYQILFNACSMQDTTIFVSYFTDASSDEATSHRTMELAKFLLVLDRTYGVVRQTNARGFWGYVQNLSNFEPGDIMLFLLHAFVNANPRDVAIRARFAFTLFPVGEYDELLFDDLRALTGENAWNRTHNFLSTKLLPCIDALVEHEVMSHNLKAYYECIVGEIGIEKFRKMVHEFVFFGSKEQSFVFKDKLESLGVELYK